MRCFHGDRVCYAETRSQALSFHYLNGYIANFSEEYPQSRRACMRLDRHGYAAPHVHGIVMHTLVVSSLVRCGRHMGTARIAGWRIVKAMEGCRTVLTRPSSGHTLPEGVTMAYPIKTPLPPEVTVEGSEAQRQKNQAALALLRAWQDEDAQEQAETWAVVQAALEADRLSDRPLFP
jgi:hypothetical protein